MIIDEKKIEKINFLRVIKNVEKDNEYFFTGDFDEAIKGLDKEYFISVDIFENKIGHLIYDELYIFRSNQEYFKNLEEYFYYINYLSTTNKQNWKEQIKDYNLITKNISVAKFTETIDWAIKEPLLDNFLLKIDLDYCKIENPIWLFGSFNPLFLGFRYGKYYYYLNYNGYT